MTNLQFCIILLNIWAAHLNKDNRGYLLFCGSLWLVLTIVFTIFEVIGK